MQVEHVNLIKKNWNKLMQITEVQSLAKDLVNKGIFTQTEISNIFFSHDERDNKERFFTEFQSKDNTAFTFLVDWLITTGHNKLARKLANKPFLEPAAEEEEEEEEDEITSSIETESPVTFGRGHDVFFNEAREPLHIDVKFSTRFYDTKEQNPHIPYYSTRSKKRGRVLIINNYFFPGTDHKTRNGAEVDEKNLRQLFEQMGGWVIKSESNLTAEEMRNALKKFTKEKREKRCDVCFVFIMSHGTEKLNETIIFGSDGRYLKSADIQGYFTNEKCGLYRGKPKVFIYQVCRGSELDIPKTYTEYDGQPLDQSSADKNKPVLGYHRPVEDMLVGFATMLGSKAHRDPYRGTWYIELICKHFMELARYEPVDNLLVKVDEDLRKRLSEFGTVQTAEHIMKGFKKLYLNPGIYEENGKLEKF